MCGINLFVDKRNQSDDSVIRKMNAATQHRGPDANRFGKYIYFQNAIFIGNNRLKIIDTSDEANQPFISPDGRYCLSFNGEIYNYKELRKQLSLKYLFRTDSDSEVLLYHLIEYGKKGLNTLNGMFAFILFDSHTGELLIARDEHGIKPVYYYSDDDFLIVSSEMKGIFSSGHVKKEFNDSQMAHYLRYKYAERPNTFYKNIYELEPGCFIETTPDSFIIKKWKEEIVHTQKGLTKGKLISDVKELLLKSVERQLYSDVSNGIFLSGGVDSTLLLALIDELGVKNFPSFSVVNSKEDSGFGTDDYLYARKASQCYNSEYNELSISSDVLSKLDELIVSIDQPIGDSAILLTKLVSEFASQKVKVALSGAGADEWFGGYNRHLAYKKYLSYLHRNNLLIHLLNATGNFIPDGKDVVWRKYIRLWNRFTTEIHIDPVRTFDNFTGQFSPFFTAPKKAIFKYEYSSENFLSEALNKDRKNYLSSDILALTDKMSMLSSLEVRVPYLDNDLTNYLSTVPSYMLLKNGRKWVLKDLLKSMGGEAFVERQKEGFGIPIGKWIKDEKYRYILDGVLNAKNIIYNYIDFNAIKEMVDEHISGKKDYSTTIWSLIVLDKWVQKEFK